MDGGSFFSDLLAFPFLRYAAAAGVLSSVACGVVGSYVTVKRIGYIAGAIAHSVLAGMGAARYLRVVAGWTFLTPVHGATAAAVVAALIIGVVSLRGRERVDTVLGAIWAIGMAVGILFIQATPGYSQELMSYLFGNILLVSPQDLAAIAVLDLVVVAVALLFYNNLLAIAFDEEFARLRGIRTERTYLLLLVLTALTIVTLAQVVGILMVIALLTLPGRDGLRPDPPALADGGALDRLEHPLHDGRAGAELRPEPSGRRHDHPVRRRDLPAGDRSAGPPAQGPPRECLTTRAASPASGPILGRAGPAGHRLHVHQERTGRLKASTPAGPPACSGASASSVRAAGRPRSGSARPPRRSISSASARRRSRCAWPCRRADGFPPCSSRAPSP